jgi:hypothetical protein
MASKKTKPTSSPELEAYTEKQRNSVNAWLAKYALVLTGDGVKRVHVDYCGSGDSGQIDHITYFDKKDKEVENPFGSEVMSKSFEELCYAILDARGWDVNNEGSQGHFDWNLKADSLVHHHEVNIVSTEDTEYDDIQDLMDSIDPDNL